MAEWLIEDLRIGIVPAKLVQYLSIVPAITLQGWGNLLQKILCLQKILQSSPEDSMCSELASNIRYCVSHHQELQAQNQGKWEWHHYYH